MNRNDRRLATKKAILAGAATNFANLRRNAENASPEIVRGVFDGWQFGYTVHPKLGNHLSALKISPTASEAALRAAKSALEMPDSAADCKFYVSDKGVMHWEWGKASEDVKKLVEAPGFEVAPAPGFEVEIHCDPNLNQEWIAIALASASAGAQMAEKLGMSTSGVHFSMTTPSGAKTCIHMTRHGEPKTPPHTVH